MFNRLPGVVGTRVGYAGGADGATYASVCAGDGNTEVVEVTFDTAVLSFEDVLEVMFQNSDTESRYQTQYESAIFPQNEEQARRAAAFLERKRAASKRGVATNLRETGVAMQQAEWYHDNYHRKNQLRLAAVFAALALDYVTAAVPAEFAAALHVLRTALLVGAAASVLPQLVPAFDKFFG